MDISGRTVLFETEVNEGQIHQIDASNLVDGMYMLKIYNDDFVKTEKVIIKK
jgi:hypothetical protein